MNPNLIPLQRQDLGAAFDLYKSCLQQYIEIEFGWDQQFQEQWFSDSYNPEHFRWVLSAGEHQGLVYCEENPEQVRLRLLLVEPSSQGRGLGRAVMELLWRNAQKKSQSIALGCFRCNTRAIKFYESMGYIVTGGDEHFVDFCRKDPAL
jgi:GNAT superfamily N-acetyltransferase